jgi:spoIIIJ-associated protein
MEDQAKDIEASIQYAKKYLEDVLSFFGLNTDIYATTEDNEVIELHVPSTHLNGYAISRVNVDIADYKKARSDRLAEKVAEWVKRVQESGQPYPLRPMNAADRRVVHKVASEAGLLTESQGEGRDRHVVLKPAE